MALPETVRVKLSSEAAGAIALTPVVVRDLPVRELLDEMLAVTGKDEARILEFLARGTLVSGGSRFRWTGWQQDVESLRQLLATFPDPDPALPFSSARCTHVRLRGGRSPVELAREALAPKTIFQRRSFWDDLLAIVGASALGYAGYSYRAHADRYTRAVTIEERERIRVAAEIVRFNTLREQIRTAPIETVELFAAR